MTLDKDGLHIGDEGSITTATGKRVNPLALDPYLVDIHDIARALSRQCRYNGHVGGFLSVARHSIWVADRLGMNGIGRPDLMLTGLLHDAAEAYLGDLVRPLKQSEFGKTYLEVEVQAEAAVAKRFGTPFPMPQEIKDADTWVLMERELKDTSDGLDGPGARAVWNSTPEEDEAEFLMLYGALTDAGPVKIIGLAGYAQSGKDTVAAFMADHGYQRRAFADKLRAALLALDCLCEVSSTAPIDGPLGDIRCTTQYVSLIVEQYGWEWAKAHTSCRELLQAMGTEAGREIHGQQCWVNAAMNALPEKVVFTDVRFPNEAEAIIDAGGEVWRVTREGTGPVNAHPSETALDDWPFDLIIRNDGTLAALRLAVDSVAR